MIVTHKESNLKYIVASIIKVPGQENLFKLEDEAGETCLVNEDTINKFFIKSSETTEPVDYFKELDNIKNKVLERDKISEEYFYTRDSASIDYSSFEEFKEFFEKLGRKK